MGRGSDHPPRVRASWAFLARRRGIDGGGLGRPWGAKVLPEGVLSWRRSERETPPDIEFAGW